MRHVIITTVVAATALGITGYFAYHTYFPKPQSAAQNISPVIFQPTAPIAASDDPRVGAENPKHTIIMFGDFQCAACGEVAAELTTVLAKHPDTQLVWKDAPNTSLHPWSLEAAIGGRCALQQKKFWEMHDALFATPITDPSVITNIAVELELDRVTFESCRTAESTRKRAVSSVLLAETYGVTATPYFFIDGKPVGVLAKAAEFDAFLK